MKQLSINMLKSRLSNSYLGVSINMAKPRIFVSSTYFDLKQIRNDLAKLFNDLGYDSIRNETGNIAYENSTTLEENCYKEINYSDVIVHIVGNKFGTESQLIKGKSISQVEIDNAIKLNKHIFIFIDKKVFNEFDTYLLNETHDKTQYASVDDSRIFKHIKYLKSLPRNNVIHPFETADDITSFLKEQFAGLLHRYLSEQARVNEVQYVEKLEKITTSLNQLAEIVSKKTEESNKDTQNILLSMHPLMNELKSLLKVSYRVFFLTLEELNDWLLARNFKTVSEDNWDSPEYFEWLNNKLPYDKKLLKISINLFDEVGNLKLLPASQWNDQMVKLEKYEPESGFNSPEPLKSDDIPF